MATYVNDLRLKEISTGDESGTWGTSTNTNLELIGEAFSFGTEAITTNADTHTTTIADGATDPGRSMFLKYTGTLDSTCTITIGPNTVSKLWFIENATSGSQDIIIKQGSGATVTIVNGQTKAIYSDGAGASGAMVDAFQDLSVPDLFVDDDLTFTSDSAVITFGADGDTTLTHTDGSGLTLNSTNKIMFNDASQFIQGSSATVLALGATDEIDLTATAIDVNGTMDVSGAITSSAGATITVADNSNNLTLTSTDGDANSGPKLDLYRNSTGPADGDLLGRINFRGRNDNSQDVDYAAWMSRISDASDGSEDGILRADVIAAGAIVDVLTLYGTEVVVNESSADVDFRVESDNSTHALFVQGSDGNVGIGASNPASLLTIQDATPVFEIDSTTTSNKATIQFTSSGTVDSKITHQANTGILTIDSGRNSSWGGNIYFVTDTETRMVINSSGNVGIGTPGGGAAFQVGKGITSGPPASGAATGSACFGNDTSDDNYGLVLGADGFGRGYITAQRTDGTAATYPLIIQPNGNNTLFGTTTDAYIHSDGVRIRSNAVGNNVLDATLNLEGSGGDFYPLNMTGPTDVGFGILAAFSPGVDYLQFQYRASGSSTNLVRIEADGDFDVPGTISKGSSTFRIDHPLPAKTATHRLVHSVVEAPTADNIYRGTVDLVDGSATVNIDTEAGMTEGTYVVLNTNTQCFTSNESGWTAVKGSVSGNTLTITAQENTCTDTVSWMVVGERKDPHMIAAKWTDENGKVIVEPLKENN